jgi:hypothetical protein
MSEIVIFESDAQPVEDRLEGETWWLTGVWRMRFAYPPYAADAHRTVAVGRISAAHPPKAEPEAAVGRISEAHPPKARSEAQEPGLPA